jgi:RND family efflux transporter MFP subunit
MKRETRFKTSLFVPLAVGLWACGQEPPPVAPELRPVRYQKVSKGAIDETRTFVGVARAGTEADLSFRVPGTVEAVECALGESVEKGQVLARLDPVDYELQVQEAAAGLALAQASVRKAEADYDRTRALYENNNASRSELDAARAGAESARSQVDAATKRLDLAKQQLAYTILRAPVDGAIALKDLEVNENVKAGDPVFMLTSGSLAEVEFAVPEIMIADLEEGMPVIIKFDAFPDRKYEAEIAEVGVAVTGSSAAFEAVARLRDETPDVRSGMAAEVVTRLQEQARPASLLVPWVAVGEDRDGRFVFVVEPESDGTGTVRRRSVTVGDVGKEIEILEGLEEGELLITAGTRRLIDGMRVKVAGEEQPAS